MKTNRAFWVTVATATVAGTAALYWLIRSRHAAPRPEAESSEGIRTGRDRPHRAPWRFDQSFAVLPAGRMLHVELTSPAIVHWTSDRWDSVHDTPTIEAEHGLHVADLATESLEPGTRIQFTFFWTDAKRWEGEDFEILVECARQHAT